MPGVFDFHDGPMASFALVKQIAATRNCEIFLAKWRSRQDMLVVLKVYNSQALTDSKMKAALKEAQIPVTLRSTGVPNVCKTFWAFTQATYFVIVQQYCEQGSLLQFFRSRGYAMTEQEACCMVVVPMLVTLWHLHQREIVHADIKIDNIFITQNRAMLGDFGMTQTVRGKIKCFMGTTEFMAPEIVALRRREQQPRNAEQPADRGAAYGFDQAADIWALGVVLYECLCGHRPWHSTEEEDVMADIEAVRLRRFPQQVSHPAKDLIMQMLSPDPEQRPSATALLSHPWVLRYVGPVIKRIQRSEQQLLQDITMMIGDSNIAKSLQQSVSSIIDFSAIDDDGTGMDAASRSAQLDPHAVTAERAAAVMPPPLASPTLLQALALGAVPPPVENGSNAHTSGFMPPPPPPAHNTNMTAYLGSFAAPGHSAPGCPPHSAALPLPGMAAAHGAGREGRARAGLSISDVSNILQHSGRHPPGDARGTDANVMQWQAGATTDAPPPATLPADEAAARPPFEQIPSCHAITESELGSAREMADSPGLHPMPPPRPPARVDAPSSSEVVPPERPGAGQPFRRAGGRPSTPTRPNSFRAPPGAMQRRSLDTLRQGRPGALLGGGHGANLVVADPAQTQPCHEPAPESDPFQPLAAGQQQQHAAAQGHAAAAVHHRHGGSSSAGGSDGDYSSMMRTQSSGYSLGSARYSFALPATGADLSEYPAGCLDASRRSGSMRLPFVRASMSPVEEGADDRSSGENDRRKMRSDSSERRGREQDRQPAD